MSRWIPNVKTSALLALLCLIIVSILLGTSDGQENTVTRNRGRSRTASRSGSRARGNNRGNNRGRTGSRGSRGRDRLARYGCEEIHLPMCKGLVRYTHTKLPNMFNHTTQLEVYRELEHLWPYMDHACSVNMRLMICSMYLPRCMRRGPGLGPCKRTCMTAKRKCSRPLNQLLSLDWTEKFNCSALPNRRCTKPVRDTRCPRPYPHPRCMANSVMPVCANISFTWGTLPNMFEQCHVNLINKELEQYHSLISSNCHPQLRFFLCGVFSPFCVRNEVPFTFPCREICEEIRSSCESHYRRLNHNLPWPNKLQCHRYPLTTTEGFDCVMPNEGNIYGAGANNV